MFGPRYFGARYFGPRYFGEGAATAPAAPTCPLASVQSFWRASAPLMALSSDGKLYMPEAIQGTELPYVTVMEVSDTKDERATSLAGTRRVSLQFTCLDRTAAGAKSMGLAIEEAFDRRHAEIGGLDRWGLQLAECNSGLMTKGEGFAPGGETCFLQTADLDLYYSRGS